MTGLGWIGAAPPQEAERVFGRGSPRLMEGRLSRAPGRWSQQGLVRTQGAGRRGEPAVLLSCCPGSSAGYPHLVRGGEVSRAQRVLETAASSYPSFLFGLQCQLPEGSGKASLRKLHFDPEGRRDAEARSGAGCASVLGWLEREETRTWWEAREGSLEDRALRS